MNRDLIYEIPESLYGHKISELLHQKGFSNQNLTALKKMDHSVMINGRWEYLNYRLRPGDLLEIHIQEEEVSEKIPPVKLPFPIIYEDEDYGSVNIVASDHLLFPCGTIVEITNTNNDSKIETK